jgi:4-hydroxy-tetrahydrodipicolinate synthase
MKKLEGVYTALVTPFTAEGAVDERSLRELLDFQIENGVAGVVPLGTTGEAPTLTAEEQKKIITLVCEHVGGRVPVIVGAGSNCTEKAIEMTKYAKEAEADATLQVAPYYNKPTPDGFYRHFTAIADAVDLPLIVYNIPGRSGKNIDTATMNRICEHKNVIGIKEASGDINQMGDVISQIPGVSVLSGDDNMTVPMISLGGKGIISVASNVVPDKVVAMVDAALKGKFEEARKLHYELMPLFKAEFIETNPIPIKHMMVLKGFNVGKYRLPMCEMTEEHKEKVKSVMEEMGLL